MFQLRDVLSLAALCGAAVLAHGETAFAASPYLFEQNRGQWRQATDFGLRGQGYAVTISATRATFRLRNTDAVFGDATGFELRILGADRSVEAAAERATPARINYIHGSDASAWLTDLPTYAGVRYANVYPGVDLVYHSDNGPLEYDFILAPGADTSIIRLRVETADTIRIDRAGNLLIDTRAGAVSFDRPVAYQEVNGTRVPVAAEFLPLGRKRIGFAVGAYDMTKPLVIDPVVTYAAFFGGEGRDGHETAFMAVDASGAMYIAGGTTSTNLPVTPGAYDSDPHDVFVAKLTPAGDALVYATYIGGSQIDTIEAMAVDASGAVYITGTTISNDYPATAGAFDTTCGNTTLCNGLTSDAFVTKLDASGSSLAYSTFLGRNGADEGHGLAVDASGAAYVTGETRSADYPTTPGAFDVFHGTGTTSADAFVTKIAPTGASLAYSTFLGGGGTSFDSGLDVAVAGDGSAHVVGATHSPDFPVTPGAYDTTCGTDGTCNFGPPANTPIADFFVTKLTPAGDALSFSTFLGGSGSEFYEIAVAVDSAGATYVAGESYSTNFPTTAGAVQPASDERGTAIIAKLDATGSTLEYSTYLGHETLALDIATDGSGRAFVVGKAWDTVPTTPNALDSMPGHPETFLVRLDADGSLDYSSYIGAVGSGEHGDAVALYANNVLVSGETYLAGFPVATPGAFQTTCWSCNAKSDAYIVSIDIDAVAPPEPLCGSEPLPDAACRLAFASGAGKSSLHLRKGPTSDRDSLKWKWRIGADTLLDDFKTPDTGTATYRLCIYDSSTSDGPVMERDIPAGGVVPACGTQPCWSAAGTKGFKYKNRAATPGGISSVKLKAGTGGKAQIQIKAGGALLAVPVLEFLLPDIVVQLMIDDGNTVECFKSAFPGSSGFGFVAEHSQEEFKATGP